MRENAANIIGAVAFKNGLTTAQMIGGGSSRNYAHPRQEAMFEVFTRCPHVSMPQLAKMLGLKDHTTCCYGVRVHAERRGLTYDDAKRMRADKTTEIAAWSPEYYAVVSGGLLHSISFGDALAFFAPRYARVMKGEAA